jgi:WD40 repeat protein
MRFLEGQRFPVRCLAFGPGGLLACGGPDSAVCVGDVSGRRRQRTFAGPGGPTAALAVTADGRAVAAAFGGGGLAAWGVGAGRPLFSVAGLRPPGRRLAFSPDGRLLAAAGHLGSVEGVLTVFNTAGDSQHLATKQAGCGVAFGPDGGVLASGGLDLRLRLWRRPPSSEGWTPVGELRGHERLITDLAFTPDGRLVSVADGFAEERCEVKVWDVRRREETATFSGPPGPTWSLTLAADGSTLAWTDTDETVVRVWDVASGRERAAYDWGLGRLRALALAPDGMTAAAAGEDWRVLVWDVDVRD